MVITLPRLKVEPSRKESAPPAGHAASNGNGRSAAANNINRSRKVLVIEDQADARRALQRLLQVWGHEVSTAEDGVRGLELATSEPPDVALVDVGLPGLDGYEVARRIRATLGDSVHLVALTGYGQPEDRELAYSAGFNVHLIKPVDRDELTHALAGGVDADRLKT